MQHSISGPKAALSCSLLETSDLSYDFVFHYLIVKDVPTKDRNLSATATSPSHSSGLKTTWTIPLKSRYPHICFLSSFFFPSCISSFHFMTLTFSLKTVCLSWPFSSTAASLCPKRQLKSMFKTAQHWYVCQVSQWLIKLCWACFSLVVRLPVAIGTKNKSCIFNYCFSFPFCFICVCLVSSLWKEGQTPVRRFINSHISSTSQWVFSFIPIQTLPSLVQVSELTSYVG